MILIGSVIVECCRLIYPTYYITTHHVPLVSVLLIPTVPFLLSFDIYLQL